jgi:hypothetical protein
MTELDKDAWEVLEAHLCSLTLDQEHHELWRIELACEVCLGDRRFPAGVYVPACLFVLA